MKVPMLDLSEQYQELKSEVLEVLDQVMSSSRFILGDQVKNWNKILRNTAIQLMELAAEMEATLYISHCRRLG